MIKITLAVAAIASVGLGAFKAYTSYGDSNENLIDNDLLLTENVLAVSDPQEGPPKNFEGGFKDCQMTVAKCVNCGMEVGAGKCSLSYNFHFSCSYTETTQVNAHMYDCWSGERLTEAECKALMQKFPCHPKANCTGH